MERHAIYYVPPATSPWWNIGSQWLNGFGDPLDSMIHVPGLPPARRRVLTQKPAFYGWHATLVAPFHLHDDRIEIDLKESLQRLASEQRAFDLPVHAGLLSGFAAILPQSKVDTRIDALTSALVTELDHFRAPLTPEDYDRRASALQDPREIELLKRWGYPYVFDRFRFHMTLTDRLGPLEAESILRWWNETVRRYGPLPVREFAWCVQSGPGTGFTIRQRFGFGSG
jgi:hypothetical protein